MVESMRAVGDSDVKKYARAVIARNRGFVREAGVILSMFDRKGRASRSARVTRSMVNRFQGARLGKAYKVRDREILVERLGKAIRLKRKLK